MTRVVDCSIVVEEVGRMIELAVDKAVDAFAGLEGSFEVGKIVVGALFDRSSFVDEVGDAVAGGKDSSVRFVGEVVVIA